VEDSLLPLNVELVGLLLFLQGGLALDLFLVFLILEPGPAHHALEVALHYCFDAGIMIVEGVRLHEADIPIKVLPSSVPSEATLNSDNSLLSLRCEFLFLVVVLLPLSDDALQLDNGLNKMVELVHHYFAILPASEPFLQLYGRLAHVDVLGFASQDHLKTVQGHAESVTLLQVDSEVFTILFHQFKLLRSGLNLFELGNLPVKDYHRVPVLSLLSLLNGSLPSIDRSGVGAS